MPIYKELVQLLPLFLLSLHARCYKVHTRLYEPSDSKMTFKLPYISTVLKGNIRLENDVRTHRYCRLFVIGNGRPLLITESYTDGQFLDRHYYYGDMRWILYDRERLVPKRPSETEDNLIANGV